MKQCMFSVVSALLLAAPLAGTAQIQQQLKPNELATNVAGVTTIAAPPKGFNPLTAADQDLEYYGFPPRPDQIAAPKAFATWQRAMSASKTRVTPVLEVTKNFASPSTMQAGAAPPSGNAGPATSPNWAGYVNENGVTAYGSSSFYYTIADYDVPNVRQASCDGTWDYAVTSTGIDGWGSSDVLQAGTEEAAYCSGTTRSTYYSAMYEWYPNGWTNITSLPVAPGDELFVEVWTTSSTSGHAYILNISANQSVTVSFSAPPGVHLIGNSAEWGMSLGGGLATRTNYISEYLSNAYAYNFGYSAVDPGSASSFPVKMVNGLGSTIASPTLLGSNAIWIQN
jgi:Peptidase A4 family